MNTFYTNYRNFLFLINILVRVVSIGVPQYAVAIVGWGKLQAPGGWDKHRH